MLLVLAAAAASVASFASLGGPVSQASAASWHHSWTYLNFAPTKPVNRCLKPRRIYLHAGSWHWRVFTAHWAHPTRARMVHWKRYFHGGWYTWTTCLKRIKNFYHVSSKLNGVNLLDLDENGHPFGDGSYHWGSTLTRLS